MAPRDRVKKADTKLLAEELAKLGYKVATSRDAVWARPKGGGYGPYGFYWDKKVGAWSFHTERQFIHTHHDLETAIGEALEERRLLQAAEQAFGAWKRSRTEKRWVAYQGAIAALYRYGQAG